MRFYDTEWGRAREQPGVVLRRLLKRRNSWRLCSLSARASVLSARNSAISCRRCQRTARSSLVSETRTMLLTITSSLFDVMAWRTGRGSEGSKGGGEAFGRQDSAWIMAQRTGCEGKGSRARKALTTVPGARASHEGCSTSPHRRRTEPDGKGCKGRKV